MKYTMTIPGKLPSKSNSYIIINIAGHASLGKSKALKDYEKAFYLQCPCRGANIKGYFRLEAKVFHENNRPDLDNGLKINPRVEITIEEVEL